MSSSEPKPMFRGGPLDGEAAPNHLALYRSAEDGRALRPEYGDRWMNRHDQVGVERRRGIYYRNSDCYVWAGGLDNLTRITAV